ncbi:hypothetical protein FEF26_06195 [Nesterenkonia salmonea]|uniref:Uncharacterized protein n=1 Tax=Nesterenkonia salmonea TaxID=1804987 RepID=A0A5R9BDD6_9MICC|nr:hypothetical protein [Nesterenkonia salmonea]TLP98092.1 hypothetical protein FEF26_06195 [Nesterenkonia salmonea]
MSAPDMAAADGEAPKRQNQRRGNRRVTAPATSGQPEALESQVHDPLSGQRAGAEHEGQQRAEWLKSQRPPHWED